MALRREGETQCKVASVNRQAAAMAAVLVNLHSKVDSVATRLHSKADLAAIRLHRRADSVAIRLHRNADSVHPLRKVASAAIRPLRKVASVHLPQAASGSRVDSTLALVLLQPPDPQSAHRRQVAALRWAARVASNHRTTLD